MMRVIVFLAGLCLMPLMATAQDGDRYYPPIGCTGTLTIQSRGCVVSHIYTCAADQPGDSWRVMFRQNGPVFLSKIDSETQWLESYDLFPTRRDVLIQPAADPASLTDLLEYGADSYDFTQTNGTSVTRVVGYDRLTGEDVVIDGEPLLGTEFAARFETSTGSDFSVTGREFISVKHRRFVSGVTVRERNGETIQTDQTPVDFIYPGEPGFFSKTPLYECEASLAHFVPTTKGSDQ